MSAALLLLAIWLGSMAFMLGAFWAFFTWALGGWDLRDLASAVARAWGRAQGVARW